MTQKAHDASANAADNAHDHGHGADRALGDRVEVSLSLLLLTVLYKWLETRAERRAAEVAP